VTHFFITHGLPLLFVVVMLESFGIPLPGETALIAFGVLASQGHHSIVSVIVLAATGGYIGDAPPYQGHVAVIDARTGRIVGVWNALCSNRRALTLFAWECCRPTTGVLPQIAHFLAMAVL